MMSTAEPWYALLGIQSLRRGGSEDEASPGRVPEVSRAHAYTHAYAPARARPRTRAAPTVARRPPRREPTDQVPPEKGGQRLRTVQT